MTRIWLIGNLAPPFTECADLLRRTFPDHGLERFSAPRDTGGNRLQFPDLILLVQHTQEEYARREIDTLLGEHPLTRIVCGMGPWCGSEPRTRGAWPLGLVVSWDALPGRVRREAAILRGESPAFPHTAGREDVALIPWSEHDTIRRTVLLWGYDRPLLALWKETIEDVGGKAGTTAERNESIDVLLADADPLIPETAQTLAQLRGDHPRALFVAATALPTAPLVERLRALGVDRVISKPCDRNRLLDALAAADAE